MSVFYFAEFVKFIYIHHPTDMYLGFQWENALSSEKADSVIIHLLGCMTIMVIPVK